MTSPAHHAAFSQLLNALRAEHEREVGALLAEVEQLRVQRNVCQVGSDSSTADGGTGLAPCVPFMCQSKFRSPNGRYKVPTPTGPIQMSREVVSPASPVLPRPASEAEKGTVKGEVIDTLSPVIPRQSKETTAVEECNTYYRSEDVTSSFPMGAYAGERRPSLTFGRSISGFDDVEREPAPANPTERRQRKPKEKDVKEAKEAVMMTCHDSACQPERRFRHIASSRSLSSCSITRRLSKRELDETNLWPVWENALGSKSKIAGGQLETWLREAMIKRAMGPLASRKSKALHVASSALLTTYLPLSPTSRFKMAWDLAAPFVLLYDVIMIPLQVFAFRQTIQKQVVELVMLAYWAFDILVSFNTAYYNEHGEVIANYRTIVRKYVTTWFAPDLAITGFDIAITAMSWAIDEDSGTAQNVGIARLGKFLRAARIVRILRLGRIAKLREVIYGIQVYIDSEAVAIAWGLCGNIFMLLILNHINACCWYWIGSSNEEYTWLKTPWQGDQLFEDADKWDQYFASLHWSLALFTPAGMSVQPHNLQERIYAVVSLLPGLVIFASFVSTVTAGMTRLRQIQNESLEEAFTLRKFLRENSISTDLMARVIRYVDIAMRSHKKSIPKDAVVRLKWLSGPLTMELMWELSAPTLRTHAFFTRYAGCSVAAMRQVCSHGIKVHSVSKRDTVFSSFEHAWCMYNIKCGSLVYRPAKGLKFQRRVTLEKGDWFVEQILWIRWVHHGTMKAKTESDLMSVDSDKFREVTAAHPDVLVLASEYAVAYAKALQGRDNCDVPQDIFDRHSGIQRSSSGLPGFWDHHSAHSSDDCDSGGETLFSSDSERAFDEEYSKRSGF